MSITETMLISGLKPAFSTHSSLYVRASFQTPPLPIQAQITLENDFELSPTVIHLSKMLAMSSPAVIKPAFRYYTSLTHGSLVAFAKTARWEGTCSVVPKGTSTVAAEPASTGSSQGVSGVRRNPPRAAASRASAARGSYVARRGRGRSRGGGQRGGRGGGGRGSGGDHSGRNANSADSSRLVGHGAAGSPPPPPPPSSSTSDNDMDDTDDIPYLDGFINFLLLFGFLFGVLQIIGTPTFWKNFVKATRSSLIVQRPMNFGSGLVRGPSSKVQQPVFISRPASPFLDLALDFFIGSAYTIMGAMKRGLNSLNTFVVNGWFVSRQYLTQTAIMAIATTVVLWYDIMDVVSVVHLGPAVRMVERLPIQTAPKEQLLEIFDEGKVTEELFHEHASAREDSMEEAEVEKELLAEDNGGIHASMHCPLPTADAPLTPVNLHAELPAKVTVEHQNGVPVTQLEARSGYRVRRARVRKRKNVGVGVGVEVGLGSIPADASVAVASLVVVAV